MTVVPSEGQFHRISSIQGEHWAQFVHPVGYEIADHGLTIGCGAKCFDHFCRLVSSLEGEITLAYEVLGASGSPSFSAQCTSQEALEFLRQFQEFLVCDGRHEVTISNSDLRLVWDEHDLIQVHGNTDLVRSQLGAEFFETHFELPFPHQHHVHEQFDPQLSEVEAFFQRLSTKVGG